MAFNSDAYIANLVKQGMSRADAVNSARYEAQAQAYAASPAATLQKAVADANALADKALGKTPAGTASPATPYNPLLGMTPTPAPITVGKPTYPSDYAAASKAEADAVKAAAEQKAREAESIAEANAAAATAAANAASAAAAMGTPFGQAQPTATGPTKAQIDSIAAIKALLSSYGIGDLSGAITDAVIKGYSNDTIQLIMQDPNSKDPLAVAFQTRFPANKVRSAAGKSVLSPAEYLRAERSYSEVLKSYGVSNMASKEKLSQFISNDISATEVADRVGLAINRVQNADADTKKALAEYYPMLNQADIIGAVLDPAEGLPALKRKIQIGEIGGAALAQGIKTLDGKTDIKMGASALADLGVTQEQARAGFQTVAEVTPRADFLSQISTGEDYGQLQAEQEAFKGLASAKRARLSLTEQEKARFGGSAGVNKSSLTSQTRGAI
jgi:hypothetical protein